MEVVMTIIRTEKRERSLAGKLIKWAFVAFNLLMVIWIVGGLHSVSKIEVHSTAEKLGTGIGAGVGITMLLVLWALGDLILGIMVLVTRGNKVIVEESSSHFGASTLSSTSGSSFDLGKVDQRIAQLKADPAPNLPRASVAPGSASSFGRRHA
jgi:hypothetical protein